MLSSISKTTAVLKKSLSLISVFVLCSSLVHHTVSFDYEDQAVGQSAHEPRFGERLLPLRKGKTANATTARMAGTDTNVNTSLFNKSNYYVSGLMPKFNKSYSTNGELNTATQKSVEHYTFSTNTLDEDVGVKKRQSKQLLRREDTNVNVLAPNEAVQDFNVSKADRLVEMSTEFFIVPTSSTSNSRSGSSRSRESTSVMQSAPTGLNNNIPRSVLIVAPKYSTTSAPHNYSGTPTIISTQPTFSGLRKEPWVVPVLVFACLTMLMMGAFEIFVLFKAWRTSPSRRHLFLGQMLLLGLFVCAGLGAYITTQPTLLSCGTLRFGVGVAYALVFAALLVKCVFLISLNGGVYLPAPYQGLLLLFAVLIQVAIGAQWLLTQPPEIYTLSVPILSSGTLLATSSVSSLTATTSASFFNRQNFLDSSSEVYTTRITATGTVLIPLCKTQFTELLFSLIYILFLIIFVAVLAIKSRGIRDNYREATYIGLAIGGAIPIFFGWMLCGFAVGERHKDACIAFGLVATSATIFLVMFMPKGRQLAAMGKEGLYVEDRDEQFSSLSRAGSGYSPSFFHFKPIKYGVMGGGGGDRGGTAGLPTSTTTTGNGNINGNSTKHCSGGMLTT